MDIFDLIKHNHFGQTYNNLRREIDLGESVILTGMPGQGHQYLMRFTEKRLLRDNTATKVLYMRGALMQNNAIDILSNSILKISGETHLYDAIVSFNQNKKLVIMIESVEYIGELDEFLAFLTKLRGSNIHGVVNIIGIDCTFFSNLKNFFEKESNAFSSVEVLQPFDLEGTKRNIELNNKFYKWEVPDALSSEIHKLSGGNSRLVKYICKVLMQKGLEKVKDKDFLINNDLINAKLTPLIEALFQLDIKDLRVLGMINEKNEIFSELLKYKIENYEIPNLSLLMPELTNKERKVFSYLFVNKGRLVPTDKLDFMFSLVDDNYSLWASYKAISRLKKKIKDKFELKNVKGKGYILSELGTRI